MHLGNSEICDDARDHEDDALGNRPDKQLLTDRQCRAQDSADGLLAQAGADADGICRQHGH